MVNKKMRILVVDDMKTMRMMGTYALKEIGFQNISTAEGAKEAFEMLEYLKYSLILLDWNLPKMSGIEILKRLKADERLKDIKVIMVTGESKRENIVEAIKAGVDDYIVKPFTVKVLREKIEKIFGDREE